MGLSRRPLDGSGGDELLTAVGSDKFADCLSPDGASIVYEAPNGSGRSELWRLPLTGDKKPVPLLAVPQASVAHASTSPDGRFLRVHVGRNGPRGDLRAEVPSLGRQVAGFDGRRRPAALARGRRGALLRLSRPEAHGGRDLPRRRRPGRRAEGPVFCARAREWISDNRSQYIPAPDGQRFLVLASAEDRQDQPAIVS